MTATPHRYRGVNYASRVEARWAAFFIRHIKVPTHYQPIDLANGCTPTFLVGAESPFLVHVDPVAVTAHDYAEAATTLTHCLDGGLEIPLLIVGVTPLPVFGQDGSPLAGLVWRPDTRAWYTTYWSREPFGLVANGLAEDRDWITSRWSSAINEVAGMTIGAQA